MLYHNVLKEKQKNLLICLVSSNDLSQPSRTFSLIKDQSLPLDVWVLSMAVCRASWNIAMKSKVFAFFCEPEMSESKKDS